MTRDMLFSQLRSLLEGAKTSIDRAANLILLDPLSAVRKGYLSGIAKDTARVEVLTAAVNLLQSGGEPVNLREMALTHILWLAQRKSTMDLEHADMAWAEVYEHCKGAV